MTGIIKTDQIQGAQGTTVTVPTGHTLAVTSNATVGGTLGVTGNTTMGGTAAITGNTTVGGTLVNTGLITASAGVAVGGTGDANTLDDYEEGTFTPTVQNATGYSAQFGTYKKIGHLVFVNANITVTSASGSTNVISSLPFTSANTGNSAGNLSIGYYSDVNTAMVWLSGYVLNASTNVYISGNSAGHTGATIQHNGASMFKTSGNSRIMFSVVYEAA